MTNPTPYQTPSSEVQSNETTQHRTGIPKVFGIINIVYGCFGLIALLASLVIIGGVDQIAASLPEEDAKVLKEQMATQGGASYISTLIGFVLSVAVIVAGVFLLKYKMLGRKLTIGYSVCRILATILLTIISYKQQLAQAKLNFSNTDEVIDENVVIALLWVGLIIGVLISCLYPVLCLIFMNKEKVKKVLS